ncbi:MAG: glutaredoxin 3 [Rickettsiales bacterium]|jgi:glutaredoxin 3|nr:glutaredoxin 3 [Rickettsiales bacterium]
MSKILMYKTPICPYCVKAMNLFKNKNVEGDVKQIDITTDSSFLKEMLTKTGGKKTVPQIFIDDLHIGGCDELYALDSAGKLDELLK